MKIAFQHTQQPGLIHRLTFGYIKWRLKTQYPHAGVVVGNKVFHTTLKDGLHQSEFDPEYWTTFNVTGVSDVQALAAWHRWKYTPYDWFSLLGFELPVVARDRKSLYCYEWVWLVLTGENPTTKVTPESILVLLLKDKNE
jgi:hypothetical protein